MQDHRTEDAHWTLRLVFGRVSIVAGLDEPTNLLTTGKSFGDPARAHA